MTPHRGRLTRLRREERGAIIVVYAILIVVLLGMAAFVLDVAMLRQDVRASRNTADLSVVAGVMDLDPFFGGDPFQACVAAWFYFLENTPEADGSGGHPCAAFEDMAGFCPSEAIEATAEAGPYTITITWPVPNDSPLMQGRYDPGVDGDPCERLAVTVRRTRGFAFAGVLDADEGSTTVSAVARSAAGDHLAEIASLVILDPHGCSALATSGQGMIWVHPAVDEDGIPRPGIITVDSAGSDPSGCSGAAVTIDAGESANTEIKAGVVGIDQDGRGVVDPTKGLIFSHALHVGNISTAYKPSHVEAKRLLPQPRAGRRITRAIVDHEFNCKTGYPAYYGIEMADCAKAGEIPPYIDNLRSYIGNSDQAPGSGEFREYTGPCSTQPSTLPITLLGNWWINCTTFSISNSVTFGPDPETGAPGRLVFQGGISLGSQAVMSVNAGSGGDTYLYLRNGNFTKGAQASLTLERTMLYIHDGGLDFGAGSGTLRWTAPLAGNFEDLALWSETVCTSQGNTPPCELGGQATLELEGVFFLPNARPFRYTGQPGQQQTKAQFFAYSLEAKGQGALIMAPDPTRNLRTPLLQAYLIR